MSEKLDRAIELQEQLEEQIFHLEEQESSLDRDAQISQLKKQLEAVELKIETLLEDE